MITNQETNDIVILAMTHSRKVSFKALFSVMLSILMYLEKKLTTLHMRNYIYEKRSSKKRTDYANTFKFCLIYLCQKAFI